MVAGLLGDIAQDHKNLAQKYRKLKKIVDLKLGDQLLTDPESESEDDEEKGPVLEAITSVDEHSSIVLSPHCKVWLEEIDQGYSTWNDTTHGMEVALYFLGKRWRADRQGNFWNYVGPLALDKITGLNPTLTNLEERSRYWTRVSRNIITQLYEEYKEHLGHMGLYVMKLAKNAGPEWNRLLKQKRLPNVAMAAPVSEKAFVKIMKENHTTFPSLRRERLV